jgi:hypothetical protein
LVVAGFLAVNVWNRAASHSGFMLRRSSDFPDRVAYNERDYSTSGPRTCDRTNGADLALALDINVLFGDDIPVFVPRNVDGTSTALFAQLADDCYTTFSLEGGP